MTAPSKKKLQEVLTARLHLQDPRFVLEKAGTKWCGSIISATFMSKKDQERQKLIWDALDAEFGSQSVHWVGTLLAYTLEEFDWDKAVPA
jgi:acid stress-induced BolA-like protein IbaG/YrbA